MFEAVIAPNEILGAAVAEWLSSWAAEQEVRLTTWISESGYLLLPSRKYG